MKRTIIALIIAFVTAVGIASLQLMDLATLLSVFEVGPIGDMMVLVSLIFEVVISPWTLLMLSMYIPLAALGVAGFLAGLISKSPKRMLPVSLVALLLFFLMYFLLNMVAGLLDFSSLLTELQTRAIDLGIAFFLLFIPGIIGAIIRAED
jgi:hypothetical protein